MPVQPLSVFERLLQTFIELQSNGRVEVCLCGQTAEWVTVHRLLLLSHDKGLFEENKTLLVLPFSVLDLGLLVVNHVKQLRELLGDLFLKDTDALIENLLGLPDLALVH